MNLIPEKFFELAEFYDIPEKTAALLFKAITHKKSVTDLAAVFAHSEGITKSEAYSRLSRVKKEYKQTLLDPEATPVVVKPYDYVADAREEFAKFLGKVSKPKTPKKSNSHYQLEVLISDLHIPFCDYEGLNRAMSEPAERLFVLGDVFDGLAATKYRQDLEYVNLRKELAMGRAFFERASETFSEVYAIKGNHDMRASKRIQEVLPSLNPLVVDPITQCTQGLDNVEVLTTTLPGTKPDTEFGEDYSAWFMGIFEDTLLGHFEQFCGADAPLQLEQWIGTWAHFLPDEITDVRVITQAHTHRLNLSYTPSGRVLISTGCLCRPMPYQFDNHSRYKPPVTGYVKWYRDTKTGLVDLDSITLVKI